MCDFALFDHIAHIEVCFSAVVFFYVFHYRVANVAVNPA